MTPRPVDFIALEFPGIRFKGEILPEFFDSAGVLIHDEFAAAKQKLLAG